MVTARHKSSSHRPSRGRPTRSWIGGIAIATGAALALTLPATATAQDRAAGANISDPPRADSSAAGIVRGDVGARLDEWMQRMERFGMHGAVLVERDGEVILQRGCGVADHGSGRRFTADTVFDIGSLGKQFTATAIVALAQDGQLGLHDPIADHLDGIPEDKQGITIHHLLTHSAGFAYQGSPGDALAGPLAAAPGERWQYSNPGYVLLGQIIERRSGMSFADYLRTRLFEPAGMTRTCCTGTRPWPFDDNARAYTDATDQGTVAEWEMPARLVGAGGVSTCVADLRRWDQALRDGSVLDAEHAALLTEPHMPMDGRGGHYGYGWMVVRTERDTGIVLHQGNIGGFNSSFRRYVDEGMLVVFLSNHFMQGRSMRDAVMNHLTRLMLGDEVPWPPEAAAGPAEDPPSGLHQIVGGGTVDVVPSEGGIVLVPRDAAGFEAVFAPDAGAEGRAFLSGCAERTRRLVDLVRGGDAEATRPLVSPALPFDGAWPALRSMLAGATAEDDGAGPDGRPMTLVGTALAADGRSARTYIRFGEGDSASLMQITWTRGGLLHCAPVEEVASRDFLHATDGRHVAFDIFSGASLVLEEDADGSLVARGDSGDPLWTARPVLPGSAGA